RAARRRRVPAAPRLRAPRRDRRPPAVPGVSLRASRARAGRRARVVDARRPPAGDVRRRGADRARCGGRVPAQPGRARRRDRRAPASAAAGSPRADHLRPARRPGRHHREPARRTRSRERAARHPAPADPRLGRDRAAGGRLTLPGPPMRSVLAALLVTLTVACAPRAPHPAGPDAVEVAARDEGRVAACWRARTVAGAGDYCLGPGDLLTVNVFGWDAMRDLHVRVSETGAVSLPLIGDVNASGRTE